MYPHLLDLVLAHASRPVLFAFRATSRSMRVKADALLAYHIVLRERHDATKTYVAPVTIENPEGRLPLFYLWDEAEDDNLGDWPVIAYDRWWAASEEPDTALAQRAYGARQCLRHTRILDIAGDVDGSRIVELTSGLRNGAILRALRGDDGLTILHPHTEHNDDTQQALDRPFSKFIAFANVWDFINMPEFQLLHVNATKVIWNLFVEEPPACAPVFEQNSYGPTLGWGTSELVVVFRPSPNPGPFSLLERVEHLGWLELVVPGRRDGRLVYFWDWLLATGVKITLVNLAALKEAWALDEEVDLRRRGTETGADIRFLTLDEYENEAGEDLELETAEGAWCHWKSEPPTPRELGEAKWRTEYPDSESDMPEFYEEFL
ncbi:hypothetical protein CC85DRAFT_287005 [Cutaneotrichosporon oleaginosum]|uniref:Uncharacterized protein n=1 Tax=Cutaneotrichosporon oleaginosum TaxID=879819 RepID=A0A0J0XID5_9TREE|nr:uncharacterized protein CC85DRAFT_287005 [Cutaneotrichosporon oleaginosum]KLT40861.1 hypothetical protein CC85DRAFT_287005 [Cutaneotrichosporon oleaginosum]TXT09279.1 hypothetical protein COLE_03213 [Cutaneotrichosporon oleaginosum]